MISIVMEKAEGHYSRLSCLGHAGYADSGKDIVCAAASILVINTLNAIEKLADTSFSVSTDKKDGRLEAEFPNNLNDKAVLLLDALAMGLTGIKEQYGKRYIRFQVKEVWSC